MVEPNEFQKGEKHMLRKLILLSNKHNDIKKFVNVMEQILKQHDAIFQEDYLESY